MERWEWIRIELTDSYFIPYTTYCHKNTIQTTFRSPERCQSNNSNHEPHQQKILPSGRNGSVGVDALRQSHQRHPGGRLLRARPQLHASRCISLSDWCFTSSSRSVGLLL
jgi:hypothetical protein